VDVLSLLRWLQPADPAANWLKLVCFNFPFAWFTQVFFIQPLVRTIFKRTFGRRTAAQAQQA